MSNLNHDPEQKLKSKYDLIADQLIGIEISDNDIDYGYICKVITVVTNRETYYKCVTNLGKTFNANKILNMIAINNNNNKGKTDEDSDDKVTVLPIGYPDGTEYAKRFSGPHKMHIAIPYVTEAINNRATVSNSNSNEKSEVISITSHSTSDNAFPEENCEGYAYKIRAIQNQRRLGNI